MELRFRFLCNIVLYSIGLNFHWGFLDSSIGKESACITGDLGSIPGLGRSPGEGKGYPFQYSRLENSMDYIVHVVGNKESDMTE